MKNLWIVVVLCLLIGASISLGKGKIDLSGIWSIDREKTEALGNQIFLAGIQVTQKKDSLITVRTYENEYGEQYPFNEKLTLDSKEHKITVYEMPRTASAVWSEDGKSILIKSTTTYYGDGGAVDFKIAEKWYLQEKGELLCNEYTSEWGEGERKVTIYYRKK